MGSIVSCARDGLPAHLCETVRPMQAVGQAMSRGQAGQRTGRAGCLSFGLRQPFLHLCGSRFCGDLLVKRGGVVVWRLVLNRRLNGFPGDCMDAGKRGPAGSPDGLAERSAVRSGATKPSSSSPTSSSSRRLATLKGLANGSDYTARRSASCRLSSARSVRAAIRPTMSARPMTRALPTESCR